MIVACSEHLTVEKLLDFCELCTIVVWSGGLSVIKLGEGANCGFVSRSDSMGKEKPFPVIIRFLSLVIQLVRGDKLSLSNTPCFSNFVLNFLY